MHCFNLTIEELISEDFSIQAESKEEAINKAITLYKQGVIELSPGYVEAKRIHIHLDDSDEWIDF